MIETHENQQLIMNILPQVNVNPPERFKFTSPGACPLWRKRFERYMLISGQISKPDNQSSYLYYG